MDAVNHIKLAIPRAFAQVTLRALIHSILFQRNMEAVEPHTFDALDAAVVCAPTDSIEKEIRAGLVEFAQEYLETGAPRGELAVVFLQKRPRKGWFATTEELIPWELHLITLDFTPSTSDRYGGTSSAGRVQAAQTPPSLVPALTQILMFCANKRHAVPPLGGTEGGLSHQLLVNPPSPSELFSSAPSPPLPARSPPPTTSTTVATATFSTRDPTSPRADSAAKELRGARSSKSDRPRDRGRGRSPDWDGTSLGPRPGHGTIWGDVARLDKDTLRRRQNEQEERSMEEYRAEEAEEEAERRAEEAEARKIDERYEQMKRDAAEYDRASRERSNRGYGAPGHSAQGHRGSAGGEGAPAQGGYLDAAKDGLRAVKAGAGVVVNWAGRGR